MNWSRYEGPSPLELFDSEWVYLDEHLNGFLRGSLLVVIQGVDDGLHHGARGRLELVPVRWRLQVLPSP